MPESTIADQTRTVLVVEDDPDFQYLVKMILAAANGRLEVIPAQTGQQALVAALHQRPDVVILDLMLPDMNGWEVFMSLRADPNTARIPVIILSSQGTRHDVSFGLQVAQVHDYLTKPCLPSRLQRSVRSALGRDAAPPK